MPGAREERVNTTQAGSGPQAASHTTENDTSKDENLVEQKALEDGELRTSAAANATSSVADTDSMSQEEISKWILLWSESVSLGTMGTEIF